MYEGVLSVGMVWMLRVYLCVQPDCEMALQERAGFSRAPWCSTAVCGALHYVLTERECVRDVPEGCSGERQREWLTARAVQSWAVRLMQGGEARARSPCDCEAIIE